MTFDGRWLVHINTPIGKQEVLLDIQEGSNGVTGTATQGDETVVFNDPVIDGARIRWSQNVTKPMKLTVKFDLTKDGDALSGTAKPGIFPATAVSGTRQ